MLTNKLKDKLSISEIAEWQQQAPEDTLVQLPKIQRGFVWKSSQIENIWDSILRGFPIGSFLFSITGDGHYNLMDGQQRATAIALGFFNQYESDRFDFWRLEDPDHFQTVWLDLAPKEFGNNKYLIRVTTRSHPWGYKAKNNGDRLSVKDMQEALKNFKRDAQLQYEDRYYEFSNTKIYPYDTTMPVPLSVLLDEKYNYDADSIIAYLKQVIPPFIKTKHGSFTNREEYIEQLSTLYYEKLKLILSIIGTRIFGEGKLLVNHDDLSNDVLNDDQGETDKESESPILFVRMNTAGTRLSNDDLIYSLYKSIFPDSQSLVEEAGLGFLTAPQVMSLVARLAESELNGHNWQRNMSIRDFQIKIKNDLFVSKLNELVSQGIIKDIIQVAKDALLNEDVIDVPPVLVKDLIKKSPDLFLFLLSWIRNNGRPRNSAHVLGKMFVFSWFKLKKASVLFENKENLNSMFWEESIKKYITNDVNSLRWLVSPKYLRELYLSTEKMWDAFYSNLPNKWHPLNDDKSKIYLQYQSFSENSSLSLEQANIYFEYFFTILRSERRLLYFSQRRYLNDKFKDYNSLDGLEDTNRPWDIDHIYPKSWKNNYERHHKVKQPFINDWIGTNGNFRAISLTDNRSENNLLSPGERLDSPVAREQAFITDKQWSYWSKLDKATRKVYMDNAEGNKNFFYAIVTRILDIYEEFWNTLQLDKLMD